DASMSQEIMQDADQAKQQAQMSREKNLPVTNTQIPPQTAAQITQIQNNTVNVNEVMQSIETAHKNDLTQAQINSSQKKG
ncbi:hypothetical protein ABFV54_28430, partial [Pseudomonas syringae]